MSDIFISYAHEDRDRAQTLAKRLREAGWSVWWDPELRAGEHFAEVIEEVLQQVHAVIVLWSEHSVASRWVKAEANEGLRQDKLIPLSLDTAEPPLIFRPIHTGQLVHWNGAADVPEFRKLLSDIQDRVSGAPEPHAKIASDKKTDNPSGAAVGKSTASRLLVVSGVVCATFVVFDFPGLIVDGLMTGLGPLTSGMPAWLVQTFLLLPVVVGLTLLRKRLWPFAGKPPVALAIALVLLATGVVVLYHWVDHAIWSMDHLNGRMSAGRLDGVRVSALDHRHRQMSLGSVPVDTQSGDFSLRYEPEFAARPVYLLVEKPGCRSLTYPISRTQWKSLAEIVVEFSCEADS